MNKRLWEHTSAWSDSYEESQLLEDGWEPHAVIAMPRDQGYGKESTLEPLVFFKRRVEPKSP